MPTGRKPPTQLNSTQPHVLENTSLVLVSPHYIMPYVKTEILNVTFRDRIVQRCLVLYLFLYWYILQYIYVLDLMHLK